MNKEEIIHGFLTAAAWADGLDDKTQENGEFGAVLCANLDWDEKSRETATKFVDRFLDNARNLIEGIDMENIGHDLWLSANGHGSGFFDRDYEYKDRLQEIAEETCNDVNNYFVYVDEENMTGKLVF